MKTQKSFRKKALLSSVAMLLVSAVAVGSATFAWFTSSTTTQADGIKVQTTKASDLKISKSNKDWQYTFSYGFDKLLRPASSANGAAWFKADAGSKTRPDYKVDEHGNAVGIESLTGDALKNTGGFIFKEQLNVMNAAPVGGANVENVKIEFTVPNNYLRIALVEADADGTETGTFATSVYDSDGETYSPITSTAGITKDDPSTPDVNEAVKITGKSTGTVEVATSLAPQAAKYYNLYVWFEGQDAQCFDTNAGAVVEDITFKVTGSNQAQQ